MLQPRTLRRGKASHSPSTLTTSHKTGQATSKEELFFSLRFSWWRVLLAAYALVSTILFSFRLLQLPSILQFEKSTERLPSSPILAQTDPNLSDPFRRLDSRITLFNGTLVDHKPSNHPTGISACHWTNTADLRDDETLLSRWTNLWHGPVSAVVIASFNASLFPSRINNSLSMTFAKPTTLMTPVPYLNLARLSAPASGCVLFPTLLGSLAFISAFRNMKFENETTSFVIPNAPDMKKDFSEHPPEHVLAIVSGQEGNWCSERLYLSWQDCVWELWLSNLGQVPVKRISGPSIMLPVSLSIPMSIKEKRLAMRLSQQFRVEKCLKARKEIEALGHRTALQWWVIVCKQAKHWTADAD